MAYSRKDLHKDIDDLLDQKGYGEDISMRFGRIIMEVSIQDGKVHTRMIDRESFRERNVAPATG